MYHSFRLGQLLQIDVQMFQKTGIPKIRLNFIRPFEYNTLISYAIQKIIIGKPHSSALQFR